MTSQRKKKFVDNKVQTGIMVRTLVYVCASVLFVSLPIAFVNTYLDPERLFLAHVVDVWAGHWPIFITILALIPFMIIDILNFSHRFAGPVYRLRNELRRFENSGVLRKFQFRERDFWREIPDGLAAISDHIEKLEARVKELEADNAPV